MSPYKLEKGRQYALKFEREVYSKDPSSGMGEIRFTYDAFKGTLIGATTIDNIPIGIFRIEEGDKRLGFCFNDKSRFATRSDTNHVMYAIAEYYNDGDHIYEATQISEHVFITATEKEIVKLFRNGFEEVIDELNKEIKNAN